MERTHDRSPYRRRRNWFIALLSAGVVLLVSLLIGLPAVHARMQGVDAECAEAFYADHLDLRGYRWSWLPPGWVCEFEANPKHGHDKPYERLLPT